MLFEIMSSFRKDPLKNKKYFFRPDLKEALYISLEYQMAFRERRSIGWKATNHARFRAFFRSI